MTPNGVSNKELTVLSVVEKESKKPIGYLVSYGLKPAAIDQSGRQDGTAMVSLDLPGYACAEVEGKLGAPCLFCMSAAGDQVPHEQSFYEDVDAEGNPHRVDNSFAKGVEIAKELGAEMAKDILATIAAITDANAQAEVKTAESGILYDARRQPRRQNAPTREMEFKADGKGELSVAVIVLEDDPAFAAVKPETNAQTERELWAASPYQHSQADRRYAGRIVAYTESCRQ